VSAFVVSQEHVTAIVRAGLTPAMQCHGLRWDAEGGRNELRLETADQVGQMLTDECVRSVSYRYDGAESLPGSYPDGLEGFGDWFEPFHYSAMQRGRCPSPVETLKLLDCLEYQSCEHPEWAGSEARAFCDALRRSMIGCLPGYDAAPWEWKIQRLAGHAK